MNMTRFFVPVAAPLAVMGALAALVGGCEEKKAGSTSSAVGVTSAAPSAAASASAEPASASASASSDPNATAAAIRELFADKFKSQALARPGGTFVSVEQVLEAFKKNGVTLVKVAQHLGNLYSATYCVGAFTEGERVALSICEYTDVKSANEGVKAASKGLSALKELKMTLSGQTLLVTRADKPGPDAEADRKKLIDAFTAIKPEPHAAPSGAPSSAPPPALPGALTAKPAASAPPK